jgi:hypothetical protein
VSWAGVHYAARSHCSCSLLCSHSNISSWQSQRQSSPVQSKMHRRIQRSFLLCEAIHGQRTQSSSNSPCQHIAAPRAFRAESWTQVGRPHQTPAHMRAFYARSAVAGVLVPTNAGVQHLRALHGCASVLQRPETRSGSTHSSGGPQQLYHELLDSGSMRTDARQVAAMQLLQDVYVQLVKLYPKRRKPSNLTMVDNISTSSNRTAWCAGLLTAACCPE